MNKSTIKETIQYLKLKIKSDLVECKNRDLTISRMLTDRHDLRRDNQNNKNVILMHFQNLDQLAKGLDRNKLIEYISAVSKDAVKQKHYDISAFLHGFKQVIQLGEFDLVVEDEKNN